jgi:hypothetical protein
MIDHHIIPEMERASKAVVAAKGDLANINTDTVCPVLNMLNTQYFILPLADKSTTQIYNPGANGNGWFVSQVKYVDNANQEIDALNNLNTKEVAVVSKDFKEKLGSAAAAEPKDTMSTVKLTSYAPNELNYDVHSAKGGVVVFAEIYYPEWTATVNGKPVDIARANYILRAIKVPAGDCKVNFKFDPASIHKTEAVANVSLILLVIIALGGAGGYFWKRKKENAEEVE